MELASDRVQGTPVTTTLAAFSSPDAEPTPWTTGLERLRDAELYWLSTVRPDGRPHVTPLLGIWLDGAMYFCTGPEEQKAKNLAQNPHCVLTTGCNTLDGLDILIEGDGVIVGADVELGNVADTYEAKYGTHFTAPGGTWFGLGDSMRRGVARVYRITPDTGFGFGKGSAYSQTRWEFS